MWAVDLKVPIAIADELTDDIVQSTGLLDLASGDIQRIEYKDHDPALLGLPWDSDDYEFTCGVLSHKGKDVEFRIDVNKVTGQYSVSATELLEIKLRAAALFAGLSGKDLLVGAATKPAPARLAPGESKPRAGRTGRFH